MESSPLTIYASDQSLLHVELEYETPAPELLDAGHRIGIEVVRAADAFARDWLAPLGVGFSVVYRDPDNFFEETGAPERGGRVLIREGEIPAPVVVNPAVADSTTDIVSELGAEAIGRALNAAVGQPAPTGMVTGLDTLWWTAVKARSPDREPLPLAVGTHQMVPPSRSEGGALWYLGPSGIAGPPVRIIVTSTHWIVTMKIDVFWELWISNAAGRAMVDAGLARVRARGWR